MDQNCILVKQDTREIYDLEIGPWMSIFVNNDGMEMGTRFKIIQSFGEATNFYSLLLRYVALGYNQDIKLKLFKDITHDIYRWCGIDEIEFYNKDTFEAINFLDKNWKEIKHNEEKGIMGMSKLFQMNHTVDGIMINEITEKNLPQKSWVKSISTNYRVTGSIIKLEDEYHDLHSKSKGWWSKYREWYKKKLQ